MSPGPRSLFVPDNNISWDNQLEHAIRLVKSGSESEVWVHRHRCPGPYEESPCHTEECVVVLQDSSGTASVVLVSERAAPDTGSVD